MNVMKDANGQWVLIKDEDLLDALFKNYTSIYGVSIESILAFKEVYEKRGGKFPITPQSIDYVF